MARPTIRFLLSLGTFVALSALTGCASDPPKTPDNACHIFDEKPDWFESTRAAEQSWGLPMQIQLAIVRQESSFRHDAKPPRDRLLGIPMWWRVSSAYGYAQAMDGTWNRYRRETGNRWADRDDFEDAVDFIGWYADLSQRTLGISKWDSYNQYLAYHEGQGGWKRKSYERKPWLKNVARKVDRNAGAYGEQLRACRDRLERRAERWWPF